MLGYILNNDKNTILFTDVCYNNNNSNYYYFL